MTADVLDTQDFIRTLLTRGWAWDRTWTDRLVHPTNREFFLVYDEPGDRLTVSRALDEHLKLVIPSPPSKSKSHR